VKLNGRPIDTSRQQVRYAANGRDTRIHTVTLGPYQEQVLALQPAQLRKGENILEGICLARLDQADPCSAAGVARVPTCSRTPPG
jgi:hypothetical protein